MTDLEKLRDLLNGFGLTWQEDSYSFKGRRHGGPEIDVTDGIRLTLSEKDNEDKADGYSFFFADFIFDHEERFVQAGFWE